MGKSESRRGPAAGRIQSRAKGQEPRFEKTEHRLLQKDRIRAKLREKGGRDTEV